MSINQIFTCIKNRNVSKVSHKGCIENVENSKMLVGYKFDRILCKCMIFQFFQHEWLIILFALQLNNSKITGSVLPG